MAFIAVFIFIFFNQFNCAATVGPRPARKLGMTYDGPALAGLAVGIGCELNPAFLQLASGYGCWYVLVLFFGTFQISLCVNFVTRIVLSWYILTRDIFRCGLGPYWDAKLTLDGIDA